MTITDRCFQLGFLSKLGPIIVVISSYAWDFMVGFVQLRGIQTIQVDFFGFCPFTFFFFFFWVLSFHFWATRCNIIIIKKNSRWETWPWKVTTHPITGALILTWRRRLVFFTGDQIVDERTLRTGMVYKRHSGGICQLDFSSEILQKIAGTLTIGWWYKLFSKPMKPYFTKNIFTINIVRIILTKLSNTHAW